MIGNLLQPEFTELIGRQNYKEQVYGPHYLLVAATVAYSRVGVVLFGSFAMLVDVTGLVIYFSIAYHILHGTLL